MKSRWLSYAIYIASLAAGGLYFLYPFLTPELIQGQAVGSAHAHDTALLYILLLMLCLGVLLYEVQGETVKTRQIALLGVLTAVNSVLRFIDIAIPAPGGFSPIFFLILLTGVVFGGRFGFLMGALTLFVSAIITGGMGPWLPAQMFTAGWVGMSAALLRPVLARFKWEGSKPEIWFLMAFGFIWGLLYGAIMNLWAWPFMTGPADQYWAPGVNFSESLQRYGVYYLVTSLAWDVSRSIGNVLMIGLFGAPTLRALRRFEQRLTFYYAPGKEGEDGKLPVLEKVV
jgi:energy-coupling factor transport system substrate-specific component